MTINLNLARPAPAPVAARKAAAACMQYGSTPRSSAYLYFSQRTLGVFEMRRKHRGRKSSAWGQEQHSPNPFPLSKPPPTQTNAHCLMPADGLRFRRTAPLVRHDAELRITGAIDGTDRGGASIDIWIAEEADSDRIRGVHWGAGGCAVCVSHSWTRPRQPAGRRTAGSPDQLCSAVDRI